MKQDVISRDTLDTILEVSKLTGVRSQLVEDKYHEIRAYLVSSQPGKKETTYDAQALRRTINYVQAYKKEMK